MATNFPRRSKPQALAPKERDAAKSALKQWLENKNTVQFMREAVPQSLAKTLDPDRVIKIVLACAARPESKLLECTPQSIAASVVSALGMGLEPGGPLGHAYLVPFKNGDGVYEAQLIPGYRGYVALARRSGEIQSVEAHVVRERDEFDVEFGSESRIVHRPQWRDEPGPTVASPACFPV